MLQTDLIVSCLPDTVHLRILNPASQLEEPWRNCDDSTEKVLIVCLYAQSFQVLTGRSEPRLCLDAAWVDRVFVSICLGKEIYSANYLTISPSIKSSL